MSVVALQPLRRFVHAPSRGDLEQREEGGTPAIIGSIRAGLVFQLHDAVGPRRIVRREQALLRRALERWEGSGDVQVLGERSARRLSIVSFLVGRSHVHHNFVATVLSDLLGIQARSGCMCAGPYGHRLLGISEPDQQAFERQAMLGNHGIKPGWVRINFSYFFDDATFEYLVRGIELVAREGWRILPEYRFEARTGMWRHRERRSASWQRLSEVSYGRGTSKRRSPSTNAPVPRSRAPVTWMNTSTRVGL